MPKHKPTKIDLLAMMMAANARAARVALIALAAVRSSRAFLPWFPLPRFSTSPTFVNTRIPASKSAVLTQAQSTLVPSRRHRHVGKKQPSHADLFLLGLGGGGRSSASTRSGAPANSKAKKAVESNAVFVSRTDQVCGSQTHRCSAGVCMNMCSSRLYTSYVHLACC